MYTALVVCLMACICEMYKHIIFILLAHIHLADIIKVFMYSRFMQGLIQEFLLGVGGDLSEVRRMDVYAYF